MLLVYLVKVMCGLRYTSNFMELAIKQNLFAAHIKGYSENEQKNKWMNLVAFFGKKPLTHIE